MAFDELHKAELDRLSGETMAQREEVCAAWHALPDELRKDDRLTRLFRALGGTRMDDPSEADAGVAPSADTLLRELVAAESAWKNAHPATYGSFKIMDADDRRRAAWKAVEAYAAGVKASATPLRSANYADLSPREQWDEDKRNGYLDLPVGDGVQVCPAPQPKGYCEHCFNGFGERINLCDMGKHGSGVKTVDGGQSK